MAGHSVAGPVLGITIVYALAGAVIGYGSQQLSNPDTFYEWRRCISIGAGVVLVGLAGSPLDGTNLLFLLSTGMGVPPVVGAITMAKVLPTPFKMEKAISWIGLAGAILIAG
jgi:hypothetical protein